MLGRIRWEALGRFQIVEQKTNFYQLPIYEIALSPVGKLLPLRLKKANMLFNENKIQRVITPCDFQQWEYLSSMRPYDSLPILQSLGGELLLQLLKERGENPRESSVVLQGDCGSKVMEEVAFTLAPQIKELVIPSSKQGLKLQEKLFFAFGLAPCSYREQVAVVLSFQEKVSYCSYGTAKEILSLHSLDSQGFSNLRCKKENFPEDISSLTLIALLLQTKRLEKKDLDFS